MIQEILKIQENKPLTEDVWLMKLGGNVDLSPIPGQFVNVSLPGFFLRRPFSVCDYCDGSIVIIYKILGQGTLFMSRLVPGKCLDVLYYLGNGFDSSNSMISPLLVAGGVGIPPIYHLTRFLIDEGKHPELLLGFNSNKDIFFLDEFRALGVDVTVCTADGSFGIQGFVTDGLTTVKDYTYVYACGPNGMLERLDQLVLTDGQFSLEARMGCGFGACMGCSIQTFSGPKRVCRDGPVFERKELLWRKGMS